MLALLLTPAYLPFAIAFAVMVGIGLIEAIGLGLGHLDLHGDIDSDGGVLDWLGLGGELPILVWLTALLGCFTLAGIAIQQGAAALLGAALPPLPAAGGALVLGVLANTVAARGLSRVLPGFETSVISSGDLLRRRGTILEGTARRGHPARAKIVDQHGQAHVVLVEPHADGDVLPAGASALIVRRAGALFFAVPDAPALLSAL